MARISNNNPARGILQMCLAALSFGFMAACVKFTSGTLPPTEIVFFRSFLGTIAIGVMIWKSQASWVGKNIGILLLRGGSGFLALSLHFYAISKLDLGTAVMLNYTAPIFVVIFARFMLKEKTTLPVKIAILISFVGLYLLASPQFEAKLVPFLLGLLSGIFAALAYVFIRTSDENESPYTIIFYFTGISTLGSIPLLTFGFYLPNTVEWIGLLGVTAGAFFGQVWLTNAIRSAPVSVVLPFGYLAPVFSSVLGFLFWKESLGIQALFGGLLITASGVIIYLLNTKRPFLPLEE